MPDLLTRARAFATEAHAGQLRKYGGHPFIVHPLAVAETVASVTSDPEIIAAALLHDTVEDTPVTLADIEAQFGPRVAALVSDLTDISRREDGNRATRRALDRAHTAAASPDAKTIKIADVLDNLRSLPAGAPFARVYTNESRLLLPALRDGNATLYHRLETLLAHLE